MNEKLERIKAALRLTLELDAKATPGPWIAELVGSGLTHIKEAKCKSSLATVWHPIVGGDRDYKAFAANRDFIAHARTYHPAAARALLTAIEGHESVIKSVSNIGEPSEEAAFAIQNAWSASIGALETIFREWPEE